MDEVGNDQDYNVFREKLIAAKEKSGKSRPSYAIYDVEFELAEGEGKRYERLILWQYFTVEHWADMSINRSKIAFITYINQDETAVKVRTLTCRKKPC